MFHKPTIENDDIAAVRAALKSEKIAAGGTYTQKNAALIAQFCGAPHVAMTHSCTHALEIAVRLAGVSAGDEVIVPTYSFPSAGNAVLLAGGVPVFCGVSRRTLCLRLADLKKVVSARSKAVIVVHYGGICEDIDSIVDYCRARGIVVIEDAAQAYGAFYKGKALGSYGDFGCFSFHQTKNETAGEGGALLLNQTTLQFKRQLEYWLDKGTNRAEFIRGDSSYYSWQALGSSAAPSELVMALLHSQLLRRDQMLARRKTQFLAYCQFFEALGDQTLDWSSGFSAGDGVNNYHLFYVVFATVERADHFIAAMAARAITVARHFVPLHLSPMGQTVGRNCVSDSYFDTIFKRLVRLPLYAALPTEQFNDIMTVLNDYWSKS